MKKTASQITRCGVMDGDGRFSKPMHPISKWRRTTKRIAYLATSQPNQPTGYTFKVIRFSCRSKTKDFTSTAAAVVVLIGGLRNVKETIPDSNAHCDCRHRRERRSVPCQACCRAGEAFHCRFHF